MARAVETRRKSAAIVKTRRNGATRTATALTDLVGNPENPRKPWSADELASFRQSLIKFGDLGGIVRNLTTNQLIGGHKRVDAFRAAAAVKVVAERQPVDKQGTVAHGYVLVDGHRFAYREVEWSKAHEMAANLAANRWGAEWDWQLVSSALKTIGDQELLALTGFADHELRNLMAADWNAPARGDLMGETDDGGHGIHLSAEQYALLIEAKAKLDPTAAISDAGAIEAMCRRVLQEPVVGGRAERQRRDRR
jgi:hypothetical protein